MVRSDPGASRLIVDVEPEARGKEVHHHLVGLVRLEAKRLGAAEELDATLMNWPNREPWHAFWSSIDLSRPISRPL